MKYTFKTFSNRKIELECRRIGFSYIYTTIIIDGIDLYYFTKDELTSNGDMYGVIDAIVNSLTIGNIIYIDKFKNVQRSIPLNSHDSKRLWKLIIEYVKSPYFI